MAATSHACHALLCVLLPILQSRIQQEQERCLHYLDPSSRRPLLHEVEHHLLASHVKQILDKGFKRLMAGQRVQDLGRLYSLLGRVAGTEALREEWKQYIAITGTAIVKDEANVSLWAAGGLNAPYTVCTIISDLPPITPDT